jgi:hypothetical protein
VKICFNSGDFAAKLQNHPKETIPSLLPQAQHARCGASNNADCACTIISAPAGKAIA